MSYMPGNLTSDAFKHEIVQHESLHLPVQWLIHESDRLQQDVPKHWHEELELSLTVNGHIDQFTVEIVFATYPNDVSAVESTELVDYLYAMHYTVRHDPMNYLRITRLAYDILDELVMHFSNREFGINPHLIQTVDERLYKILFYIKAHIYNGLTVAAVAEHFDISTSYLSRYFKIKLQMSPLAYLQAVRLNKAYQYLMNTNKSMSWISDTAGFGDVKSFERLFKKKYGTSPKSYRQQFRK